MKTLLHLCSKALGAFAGLILFTLTVMIFVNVVLRYGFNSGITITEELGRLLFVWLVFAGAILAAASDSHVRVDMFIRKLPPVPKKVVATACDIIMIFCCYLITTGGWERTLRNMKNIMAVSGLPQGWLYLAGFLAGLFIGLILIVRLIARFFVKDEEPAKSAEEQESVGKLSPNALLGIMAAALVVGIAAGYAIGIPPVLLIFLAVMVLTIVMGVPIAFALITCGVVLMYYLNYWRPAAMATSMVAGADNFSLMAIPFFILAGEMMNAGGLSQRIVDLPLKLIGHLKGGLGYVAIIATVIMASLSGSAVADTAAVAAILIPMMVKAGYPLVRSAGLVSAGGIIAPIIPPSMPFIVFGVTAAVSIKDMFMGGIVPGLIMGFGLMVTWYILCLKMDLKLQPKASREEVIRTVLSSLWALFLPVVIIGGFRIGIFTATEAGAVAAVYSMFVGLFIYREMDFSRLRLHHRRRDLPRRGGERLRRAHGARQAAGHGGGASVPPHQPADDAHRRHHAALLLRGHGDGSDAGGAHSCACHHAAGARSRDQPRLLRHPVHHEPVHRPPHAARGQRPERHHRDCEDTLRPGCAGRPALPRGARDCAGAPDHLPGSAYRPHELVPRALMPVKRFFVRSL